MITLNHQAQVHRAHSFRALHERGEVFLLPNAWDAGSARLFAHLGFKAIATTSAGVAWALGYPDGEHVPLAEVIAAVRRMTRVTALPLSVDFEGGFGCTPEAIAASVGAVIDAGVAGINLEDSVGHRYLRELDDAVRRIAAARQAACEAGVPIVINARVDTWIIGGETTADERFAETLRRAHAYLEAGADCIYPIGLANPEVIVKLCETIKGPINIGARAGMANLAELGRLGVIRVSTASRLATVAFSRAYEAAEQLLRTGSFDNLNATLDYERLQHLFDLPAKAEGEA